MNNNTLARVAWSIPLYLILKFSSALDLHRWISTRRSILQQNVGLLLLGLEPTSASFRTAGSGREEYTNSIVASRDTNISPKEVYDVLRQVLPRAPDGRGIALDLGAGAGVSTEVLYNAGYTIIDAVDWSGDAWDQFVLEQPNTVKFYELSDVDFFRSLTVQNKYDCIVYNFAVNYDKAVNVAKYYLKQPTGLLLAPVNDRPDYWYKQSYLLLNGRGEIIWKSQAEVGAWSVQFQPDVTSPTCTGVWCGSFNGFEQKRRKVLSMLRDSTET